MKKSKMPSSNEMILQKIIEVQKETIKLLDRRIERLEGDLSECKNKILVKSKELTREQVEALAFDANVSDETASHYWNILSIADKMIRGEDQDFPGQLISPSRILFVLNENRLEIVID